MDHRPNDIESAAKGTYEWLLQHKRYKSWTACDRGLFWIKGKPGSGKSTLLRYALDNVKEAPNFRDRALILSFFFHGRGNELQKTPLGLFRSLLYQILSRVPDALPNLRFFGSSLPKILESRPVWLFVDALDECGEENAAGIFTDFKSLLQTPSLKGWQFCICFTCRHYPILDTGCVYEICLEHENKKDISTYVRDQLSASLQLTASEILALITDHARGIFMWACLVVKRVLAFERRRVGLKVIEKEIYATPLSLFELYDGLVRSMDEKTASLRMLQWICFATRPLTLDELRWAMAVDPDCRQRSLEDCRSVEEYISDSERMEGRVNALSCGLAEIAPSSNTPVVQFIHQSVQDFLVEKGLSTLHDSLEVADINLSELDKDSLIVGRAHYKLSRTCIRYLAMEEIAQATTHAPAGLEPAFPLLHYAATSWVAHVKQSEARNVSQDDLLSYFAWPSETLVKLWMRIYHELTSYSVNSPPYGAGMIHIVSRYQLMGPLRKILQKAYQDGTDIDTEDQEGRTPLSYAAQYGHEAVVKLLIERDDVKADSKDNYGWTPLSHAAQRGHEVVVKLLVERNDVEADSKDNDGRTPLSHAAEEGYEAVVKLLVERNDVEADSKDQYSRTPLSHAAQRVYEAVVKLLVERNDVEADSKDQYSRTPLSYAAEKGHEAVVKLLVERYDVKADSKDKYDRTPLWYAAWKGYEAVVKLLVERNDVEADSKDGYGRTPLSYAVDRGHEAVIKLLVERDDVEADSKDEYGRTPLSNATRNGYEPVVNLFPIAT